MENFSLKRVLIAVALIIFLGIGLFVGWFVWVIFTDEPPQFFPLNNSQARYTIVKSSLMGQGWDEKEATNSSELSEPRYYVEYRGEDIFADVYNKNFFRVIVGKSKVELEPFTGKDVMVTKGKFVSSSKQCIFDKCIDIYGPYVVLNIDELELTR